MNYNSQKKWSLQSSNQLLPRGDRLHQCPIPIVAITGGLGSGKSTATKWFRDHGFFTLSADELIKLAYQTTKVSSYVKTHIPHVIDTQNVINFPELRKWAFEKNERLSGLEGILYQELPSIFLNQVQLANPHPEVIIYEIPLLFEKSLESKVDLILTVTSTTQTQIERSQKRDNSNTDLLKSIIAGQSDLQEKAKKSHVVINNNGTVDELNIQLQNILNQYFECKK